MNDRPETPEEKRERLRQEELRDNSTGSLHDALNRGSSRNHKYDKMNPISNIKVVFPIKVKKATVVQTILLLGTLAFMMAAFLIGSQSHFNSKEINLASESCLENEGVVIVEKSFLNLNYSFSCE